VLTVHSVDYGSRAIREAYYRLPLRTREPVVAAYSLVQRRKRYGPAFQAYCTWLRRFETRTAAEQRHIRRYRLARLLQWCAESVPYYNTSLAHMRRPVSPDSAEAVLASLPFLDKEDICAHSAELLAPSAAVGGVSTHTSGTSGKGLRLVISRGGFQRSYACAWHQYWDCLVARGDRVATIAGHPVARVTSQEPPFWVYDRVENELFFSSQHLSLAESEAYLDRLVRFAPQLIRGYPSSLALLAHYAAQRNMRFRHPVPIVTSSETLLPAQRRVISEVFGGPVRSYYGNAERAAHLLECSAGNMHPVGDSCVVEVLDELGQTVGDGEEGELICTGLLDFAMPLLRYRIGDRGVHGGDHCPCGRPGSFLRCVTGRVEDYVMTPEGRRVGRLDHAFKDALRVREAQIVQDDVASIRVSLVPRPGFSDADRRMINEELRLRLGSSIAISYELAEHLPRTSTGKLQFVVSNVNVK